MFFFSGYGPGNDSGDLCPVPEFVSDIAIIVQEVPSEPVVFISAIAIITYGISDPQMFLNRWVRQIYSGIDDGNHCRWNSSLFGV